MEISDRSDLTTGNPLKKIVIFMIPILIGNVFQQLYSTVDTIIVGRTLGPDALAAVGGTGAIQFMVFGFSSGLASGVTVLTSQYIGAQDKEKASRSAGVIYTLAVSIIVVCSAGGMLLLPWLLRLLNIPPELYDRAYSYQFICFAGLAGMLLYNLESSLIRALGDSITPLFFLIISSVMNIILDFLFILHFHMDVAGAALATVLSQAFSGAACMIYSMKKYELLRIRRESFHFDSFFFWRHLKVGLPISIQNSITGIGMAVFQSALNSMGASAIAAYAACQKIETFSTMPMFASSMALVTYAAQNYGAGKYSRIKKGVRAIFIVDLIISIAGGALIVIGAEPLIAIFVGREAVEVISLAKVYIMINAGSLWCAALLFVYRAAVQGTGETGIPMLGGFLELLMRIFAAIVLSRIWGFTGLATAYPLAWLSAAILNIGYYIFLCRTGLKEKFSNES
ncbi:MAG: MATE family efflux transporter [Lachnospiraceae bacterium]|nr:MATE family efflux transporter [Lachnospiraceae bacterium]